MAYYKKDDYFRKNEYAAKKNMEQSKIAKGKGLSDEQAELVETLCSLRHEFHCNLNNLTKDSTYNGIEKDLISLNAKMKMANMPTIEKIPVYEDDYIDIDSIEELREIGDAPEDSNSEEYQDWYDEQYNRIYSELSDLNKEIEKVLSTIDEKYGTSYSPTGIARMRG